MSKPLVYVNTKVRLNQIPGPVDAWELISIEDCPIMHAAWNPDKQALVVQFSSVKENFVDFPIQNKKTGKVQMQERRADMYYRLTIEDHDAIQFILDNYVANFKNQNWKIGLPEQEDTQILQEAVV